MQVEDKNIFCIAIVALLWISLLTKSMLKVKMTTLQPYKLVIVMYCNTICVAGSPSIGIVAHSFDVGLDYDYYSHPIVWKGYVHEHKHAHPTQTHTP